MKNVLILTDFSDAARNALKYALSWFQDAKISCHVLLLNTYLMPQADADQLVRINDELRDRSFKKLQAEARAAESAVKGGNVDFETVSHMGTLKNIVNHIVAERKIHFLIAGDGGDLDLRSLHESRCPVFIIPARMSYESGKERLRPVFGIPELR